MPSGTERAAGFRGALLRCSSGAAHHFAEPPPALDAVSARAPPRPDRQLPSPARPRRRPAGGKLPGLTSDRGCGGGASPERCWSVRIMWRRDGAGEAYMYVPEGQQPPACCDTAGEGYFTKCDYNAGEERRGGGGAGWAGDRVEGLGGRAGQRGRGGAPVVAGGCGSVSCVAEAALHGTPGGSAVGAGGER